MNQPIKSLKEAPLVDAPPTTQRRPRRRWVWMLVLALLVGAGLICLLAALLWPLLSRFAGRLPGDIVVRRSNSGEIRTAAVSIVTSPTWNGC